MMFNARKNIILQPAVGYQPAQRWLKERFGRELKPEDIFHYQKILVALSETDKIMKRIVKIDFL